MNKIGYLVPLLLGGALTLGGCSRLGPSLPRTMLYQDQVVPLTMKRPERGAPGVAMPEGLEVARVRADQVDIQVPVVGPPWLRGASFGWGDIGTQETLQISGFDEIAYADVHLFSILGIYNRATVIAYGVPSAPPTEQ